MTEPSSATTATASSLAERWTPFGAVRTGKRDDADAELEDAHDCRHGDLTTVG